MVEFCTEVIFKSSSSQWENQDYGIQVDKQRYEYLEVASWHEIWGEKGYKGNVVCKFVWYSVSLNIRVGIVTCRGGYFGFHMFCLCVFLFYIVKQDLSLLNEVTIK